jgi:hypothetical protein
MEHDDKPYKPRDVTQRKVLLKLELSGDVSRKLQTVADTVYGIGLPLAGPAEDNAKWKTTDEVLFAEAKRSYDGVMATFLSDPKVYKFSSTKEVIWERNKVGGGLEPALPEEATAAVSPKSPTKKSDKAYWEKRAHSRKAVKPTDPKAPLTEAELSATFIDPFQTVLQKNATGGKGERVEVWHQKLEMLKQLTPREDLEGYEIREDYHMQQARLAAQADFQQRMRVEIQRREEWPTEIEQVEDVLYDVVDAICRNQEAAERALRLTEKRQQRSVWHPAATGYKMKPLGSIVSESGVVTAQVSDFAFSDFMISPTGRMLAVRAPPELFELHDQERRVRLEQELRRLELEELERKRPLTDKLRIAVAMARHDPAAAAKKAASDVLERAARWPRAVSERLMEQSRAAIARGLTGLMQASADPQAALEDLSSSVVQSYRNVLKRSAAALSSPAKKRPRSGTGRDREKDREPSIKDVEAIIDEEEAQAQQREQLLAALRRANMGVEGRPPVPVRHADAVQVTVTFLLSPPPAYILRPPPSWRRDMERAKKRLMGELRARSKQAAMLLQRVEESDAVHVVRKVVRGLPLDVALRGDASETDATLATSNNRPAAPAGRSTNPVDLAPSLLARSVVSNSTGIRGNEDDQGSVIKPSVVRASRGSRSGRQASGGGEGGSSDSDGPMGSGQDSEGDGEDGAGPDDMHTPRDASAHGGLQSRAGTLKTGASGPAVEHPLDHEEVHVERIRLKRRFPGSLRPEDMIPKAFQVRCCFTLVSCLQLC